MARRGRDILIKLSDGLSPPTFTTVGGMRTKTITIDNETAQTTSKDEEGWLAAMEDTGNRSMNVTGQGIFKDDATVKAFEALAITGNAQEMQFVFGNGDGIQGVFLVESFEHSGEHTDAQNYAMTLQSGAQDPGQGLAGGSAFQFIRGLYPDPEAPAPEAPSVPVHVPNTVSVSNGPYMTAGVTSFPASSYKGTLSLWLRKGTSIYRQIEHSTSIDMNISNSLQMILKGTTAATVLAMRTNTSVPLGSWAHVMMSWDLTIGATHVYLNDASAKDTYILTANPVKWNWNTLYHFSTFGASQKFIGCMADFYLNMDEYIDLSVEANRRLFITAAGDPVDLGADGSNPTGSQPAIMLQGEGNAFNINSGYGPNFAINNGPMASCSTEP